MSMRWWNEQQLIATAWTRGLQLSVKNGKLHYEGPREALDQELVEALRLRSAEIIRALERSWTIQRPQEQEPRQRWAGTLGR